MGSDSIANRQMAEWAIDSEAIDSEAMKVLVKPNKLVKKISRQKVFNPFLPSKHYKYGGRFSLLLGYNI